MEFSDFVIFIMEMVGTVAFASSGAMLAIRKEMDIFGVCVLGATTSVGGGMIRDVLLGILPPGMFGKPVYVLTALGVSVILFCMIYWKRDLFRGNVALAYDRVMLVFDAVGLAVFTVVGINTAWQAGYHQRFLPAFVGVITGVGGGLLRDVMAQEKPYILTKHVYACASIAGALVCVCGYDLFGRLGAMLAGAAAVLLIRFLAVRFRWNLPRIRGME